MEYFCLVVIKFQFVNSHPVSNFHDASLNGADGKWFGGTIKGHVNLSVICIDVKAQVVFTSDVTKRVCNR